jgi:tRNA A-37 threonylcarbamoyl transferase component Bud32
MGEIVPQSYLLLERQISTWHCRPPILTRKEWQLTAKCCNILEEDGLTKATAFLHAIGSLMCFQHNAILREYVILEPQWLTKTLATVITHKHMWVKNGTLRRSDLAHIWKPPDFPESIHNVILNLLEVFNVMFWLPVKNVPMSSSDALSASTQPTAPSNVATTTAAATIAPAQVTSPLLSPLNPRSIFAQSMAFGSAPSTPITLHYQTRGFLGTQRMQRELSMPAAPSLAASSPPSSLPVPSTIAEATTPGTAQVPAEDSVIFLPALLPEGAPENIGKLWPLYHSDDEEETGRQYNFLCIPEGLFSKMLVIFSHSYRFLALWRNGVIMEVKRQDAAVTAMAMLQQRIEVNLMTVRLRYTTRSGGSEVVQAGELLQRLLGAIGAVIKEWFKVNVGTLVECSSCLRKGLIPPQLLRYDACDRAVIEGVDKIHCDAEGVDVPLASVVPDLVMAQMSRVHKQITIDPSQVELKEPVGEGAAATVYRAIFKGEVVAVKQFKLEREGLGSLMDHAPAYDLSVKMTECRREVAVMSDFRNPNLLQLRGIILQPLSLVTDYMNGGSLFDYLRKPENPLFWPLKVRLAIDVARAMAALHGAHPAILHRDLKSPNVLLRVTPGVRYPTAVLCDFGLSGEFSLALVAAVAENPMWLAPEVLRREKCTLKSDVYAMGVIMWELATRAVFMSSMRFMSEIADAVVSGKRPDIPSAPDRASLYIKLIEQAWAQDPQARPMFSEIVETLIVVQHLVGEEDF